MKMPATVYTVLTDHPNAGFDVVGGLIEFRSDALEKYSECAGVDQPAKVIEMHFDVETGALETSRDVTPEMAEEFGLSLSSKPETAPDASPLLTHCGWTVFEALDYFGAHDTGWIAVCIATGENRVVDMSGKWGQRPSENDLRAFIDLDFPTREEVGTPSQIKAEDLARLKSARRSAAE